MTKKDLETAIINGTSIENVNVKFDIDIHEFLYAAKSEKPIIFKNCILQKFESTCIDFQEKIVFIDCTILALKMHGTTMKMGFL